MKILDLYFGQKVTIQYLSKWCIQVVYVDFIENIQIVPIKNKKFIMAIENMIQNNKPSDFITVNKKKIPITFWKIIEIIKHGGILY